MKAAFGVLTAFVLSVSGVNAQEQTIIDHNKLMDHGDGHLMDMDGGMVMGQNKDKLPAGCDRVSEDVQITVRAGRKFSKEYPGTMFGFDKHEWKVKPCTRLTVNFINEDNVRHQWMMHGLPKFMYDKGMFHLEVTGPAKVAGTLILPSEDRTYLVHCDIAQHMEKGMKGQLVVGKGSGTFPTIPGVTDPVIADNYGPGPLSSVTPPTVSTASGSGTGNESKSGNAIGAPVDETSLLSGSLILGVLTGVIGTPYFVRLYGENVRGRPIGEVLSSFLSHIGRAIRYIVNVLIWLYRWFTNKSKYLTGK